MWPPKAELLLAFLTISAALCGAFCSTLFCAKGMRLRLDLVGQARAALVPCAESILADGIENNGAVEPRSVRGKHPGPRPGSYVGPSLPFSAIGAHPATNRLLPPSSCPAPRARSACTDLASNWIEDAPPRAQERLEAPSFVSHACAPCASFRGALARLAQLRANNSFIRGNIKSDTSFGKFSKSAGKI